MEIPQHIKEAVKTTVGYSEAADKESFIVGATVAFRKATDFYEAKIKALSHALSYSNGAQEALYRDLKTLNSIINKYKE